MTEYYEHGINLSVGQAKKIYKAYKNKEAVTLRISKADLSGNFKIPLTHTQLRCVKNATDGINLKLSIEQLKHLEKTGEFMPLLAAIPAIAAALGGVGGLAGGIASAINSSRSASEGSGIVADAVGKIPIVGGPLKLLLGKIGLGIKDINKVSKGGCVKCKKYIIGSGLYLSPEGNVTGRGLFLSQQGNGLFLDPS